MLITIIILAEKKNKKQNPTLSAPIPAFSADIVE